MIQGLILKKVIGVVMEKVAEKHRIKKLQDYVEKENELDIQVKQQQKTIGKQGKYIEELEKKVATLESDSHPPIFTTKDYKSILKRIKKLENK
jgi:predicted RNase H-like nuclease (RuvC/YqgF family)